MVGSLGLFHLFQSLYPGGFIPCTPRKMCLADKLQLSKLAQKVRQAREIAAEEMGKTANVQRPENLLTGKIKGSI